MDKYTFVYILYLLITAALCIYFSWLLGGKMAANAAMLLIVLGIVNSMEINSVKVLPSLGLFRTYIPILGHQYQATIGLSVPFIGFLFGIFQPKKEYRIGSWFFLLHQVLMLPISILYTIALLSVS